MSKLIKVLLGSVARSCTLEVPSFAELQKQIAELYPALSSAPYLLRYEDEDGDLISLSSDAELLEALKCTDTLRVVSKTAEEHADKKADEEWDDLAAEPTHEVEPVKEKHAQAAPVASPTTKPTTERTIVTFVLPPSSPTVKDASPVSVAQEAKVPLSPSELKALLKQKKRECKAAKTSHDPQVQAELQRLKEEKRAAKKQKRALMEAAKEKERKNKRAASPVAEPVVHYKIQCDGCQTNPIVGVRFHCSVCPDFDLCGSCEAKNLHQVEHPLVQYRLPAVQYHARVTCDECGTSPIADTRFKCMVCPDFDLCLDCEFKQQHPRDHPLVKMRVELRSLPRELVKTIRRVDAKHREKEAAEPKDEKAGEMTAEAIAAKAQARAEKEREKSLRKAAKMQAKQDKAVKKAEKHAAKAGEKADKKFKKVSWRESPPVVISYPDAASASSSADAPVPPSELADSPVLVSPPAPQLDAKLDLPASAQPDQAPQVAKPADKPVDKPADKPASPPQPEAAPKPSPQPESAPITPPRPAPTTARLSPVPAAVPVPFMIPVARPVSMLDPALESQLQTLEAMGFTDRQHLCLLLQRHRGDLQQVVAALL